MPRTSLYHPAFKFSPVIMIDHCIPELVTNVKYKVGLGWVNGDSLCALEVWTPY